MTHAENKDTISLTEAAKAMGIDRKKLNAIRTPKSRYYHADFPKALERTELQTYVLRSEFDAYLSKLTAIADTGIDPLAPREAKPRGRKLQVAVPPKVVRKHLNAAVLENICRKVQFSLFGNDFFFYTALQEAIELSDLIVDSVLYTRMTALYKYHGTKWNVLGDAEKGNILTIMRAIFVTNEREDFQGWKGSICSELYEVLKLVNSDKNRISKWWTRRKPEYKQYKRFLA